MSSTVSNARKRRLLRTCATTSASSSRGSGATSTDDHNHDHDDAVELDEETAEALREIAQSELSVAECAAAILRANE
jgi:hypothetical protein